MDSQACAADLLEDREKKERARKKDDVKTRPATSA